MPPRHERKNTRVLGGAVVSGRSRDIPSYGAAISRRALYIIQYYEATHLPEIATYLR